VNFEVNVKKKKKSFGNSEMKTMFALTNNKNVQCLKLEMNEYLPREIKQTDEGERKER